MSENTEPGAVEGRLRTALRETAMRAVPADGTTSPPPVPEVLLARPTRPAKPTWRSPVLAAAVVAVALIVTVAVIRSGLGRQEQRTATRPTAPTTATPSPQLSRPSRTTAPPLSAINPAVVQTPFGRAVVLAGADGTPYWLSYDPARSLGERYTGTPGVSMAAGPGQIVAEVGINVAPALRGHATTFTTDWGPTGEVRILAPATAGLPAAMCAPYPARAGYCALTAVQSDPPHKMRGLTVTNESAGVALNVDLPADLDLHRLIAVLDDGRGHNYALADSGVSVPGS